MTSLVLFLLDASLNQKTVVDVLQWPFLARFADVWETNCFAVMLTCSRN